MIYLHTKNINLDIFWRAFLIYFFDQWEHFTTIGAISRPLGIFCGRLVHFFPFWYIFYEEKSGSPAQGNTKFGCRAMEPSITAMSV
jgi:hypothetical protein